MASGQQHLGATRLKIYNGIYNSTHFLTTPLPVATMSCSHTAPATGNTVGSSAQQLIDKYQLSTAQVDREIQQKDVPYLAAYFDNVEFYVDAMELSPGEQTDVHRKPNTRVAMIECLNIWKRKNLSQATYGALLEMLVKLKKEAIADQICQYIQVSVRSCVPCTLIVCMWCITVEPPKTNPPIRGHWHALKSLLYSG